MTFFQSNKKWAVYDEGDFTFLQKYYYHNKTLDLDIRYQTPKGRVQIEEGFHPNQQGKISSSGQVKLQFSINGTDQLIYSRITSHGKFGLYYDNGYYQLKNGNKINLYGGFQSNRSFIENAYKIGVAYIGEQYAYGLRMRYGTQQKDLFVHFKGSHNGNWNNGDKWRINFFTVFNPRINKIIKNGLLLGLFKQTQSKDNIFLRIESGKKVPTGVDYQHLFKQYKLNWTRQLSPNTKIGAEAKLNFSNWQHLWSNIYVGGQWKFPEQGVVFRAKVSPNLTHACSITHDIKDYGSYSFGVQMSDVGKKNIFKFGTGINLNL